MTTPDTRFRIETVAAVKSRQLFWLPWMISATVGLTDADRVATATRPTPFGDFLLEIAKERECPTCNTVQGIDEFSEDPMPINQRQCNECLQAFVDWNDENDPDAIEENWKRDVAEHEAEL